ncbi:serine/threonine-protein kinase [Nocardia sp. NPDC005978]|uniref:serine/threonine-protein kinase n=1 Tax=Nocardia sp. NPDC005978 TaxID=3156725 RepID=UPI0033A546BD
MTTPQSPPPIHALAVGDPPAIGSYRLLGRLGAGGMGEVFLGISPGRRLVAVKVVHPHLSRDREFRQRFVREVRAARAVGGFYTPAVVDADVDGPRPWSATEYIAAPALDGVVTRFGPLPADSLRELARGMAEALAAIHAAGVVHRDLKPSNVLVAADGPRVIDFGIAHSLGDGATVTMTGGVIGTPGFMSPEQARGDFAGPAGDVFSLGSVLVYAASGRGPFGDGDAVALLMRVANGFPDLSGAPPGSLGDLVAQCLAPNPLDRPCPGDMLDFLNRSVAPAVGGWLPPAVADGTLAYSRALADMTAHADLTAPAADPRRARSVAVALALVAVIMLLVAGGLTYIVLRRDSDSVVTASTSPPVTTTAVAGPVRIPVQLNPLTVTLSADGTQLFAVGVLGGVQVLDLRTNTVLRTIRFTTGLFEEAVVAPDGRRIYVPSVERNVIRILDGETGAQIGELGPVRSPRRPDVSADSALVYVPDGNGVTVFDANTKAPTGERIPTARTPGETRPLRDGSKWIILEYSMANQPKNDISFYRPGAGSVTTMDVGVRTRNLAVSADGTRAAVTTWTANKVFLIDPVTETVTGTVDMGTGVSGVALSADGSRAYVATESTATVSVIDTATAAVIDTVRVEEDPQGLAISTGNRLYVANAGSSSISMVTLD